MMQVVNGIVAEWNILDQEVNLNANRSNADCNCEAVSKEKNKSYTS